MSGTNTTQSTWLRKGAFNEKDEYYTPKLLVDLIVPFIPKGATVWCPFDTEDSEFAHAFKKDHVVTWSHIWDGLDFFEYEPAFYDYIVSNPPFTRKLEVLERCYRLGKPYAMILPLPMLNYQEVGTFFLHRNLELLIPNKKVSFDGNTASFNNSFFCNSVLPSKLQFAPLPHNSTGKNFVASRMVPR